MTMWEPVLGYAGFWKRAFAYLVDEVIVGAVIFAVAFSIGLGFGMGGMSAQGGPPLGMLLGIVLPWLYWAGFESSSYQATPGKMVLGIAVTNLQGERISFGRATGRFFAKVLSGIIFLLGFLLAAWTPRKQALHDMLAGTLVVNAPRANAATPV